MAHSKRTKRLALRSKSGPKPEVLEPFNGTFEQAIDKALAKGKPPKGWPKIGKR